MFKELLKAKRRYYGKTSFYPTALKMNEATWNELKLEGKSIAMNISHGFNAKPIRGGVGTTNGLVVFIDNDIKGFEFGFYHEDGFSKEVF